MKVRSRTKALYTNLQVWAPVTIGYKQVFQDCLRQELTVETASNYYLRATGTSHIHASAALASL